MLPETGKWPRQLLAEKVETRDEFTAALAMGYSFFQGYFFSKPVIVQGQAIPYYKRNYMRMLRELNRRELDFRALERVIKQDVTLCYTLLNYINSAYFGLRDEVTSILRAIVLLGETEVRRWASLVLFTLMGADEPPEVVVRSLIRARMCELLAGDVGLKGHESDLFLMGLFSMLDVLIGRPLGEILKGMNLSRGGQGGAAGSGERVTGTSMTLWSVTKAASWEQCSQHASRLNLDPDSSLTSFSGLSSGRMRQQGRERDTPMRTLGLTKRGAMVMVFIRAGRRIRFWRTGRIA